MPPIASLLRWIAGQRAPGPAFRDRLYQVTGLDVFAAASGYAQQTRAFETALDQLEASLRPFARGPVTARDHLRRTVNPSRVARLTNLAQLLFDEEAFADWVLLDTALEGEDGQDG